jgi:predicted membrane protein
MMENQDSKKGNSRVLAGLFLLGVGVVLFMRQFGIPMPYWLFQWPMILIIIGLFIGIRHNFRGPAGFILIIIGGFFLTDSIDPDYSLKKYTGPFIVIAIGLGLIIRPRRNRNRNFYDPSGYWKNDPEKKNYNPPPYTEPSQGKNFFQDDYIDSVSIFGSIRKVVVSKDFKGGDMVAIFGGNEIDFSQADITGRVVLDVTQIMGGTKLILPSNWDVKSEMVAFFGGIEDKRRPSSSVSTVMGGEQIKSPEKVLLLQGTSIFGGIEIRNY